MKSPERKQFLFDVFVTACEGGINHWAYIEEYHCMSNGVEAIDDFRALVSDIEADEDYCEFDPKMITVNTITKGINKILKDKDFQINDRIRKTIYIGNLNNDGCEIDADGADCIVQAGLFGDLVFG